jgi:hypothetical protein
VLTVNGAGIGIAEEFVLAPFAQWLARSRPLAAVPDHPRLYRAAR